MLLLGTDTCADLLRGRPRACRQNLLAARASSVALHLSTITLLELAVGALRSTRATASAEFEALAATFLVVAFEAGDALEAARIDAVLHSSGSRIGPYDPLIAAQAVTRGVTLVTGNARELRRVHDLRTENRLAPLRRGGEPP
jgi:tRNA(fMet)-specific endonuclease VapC